MQEQPTGNKQTFPNKPASIGMKATTYEGVTESDMAKQKDPNHMGVWEKLVGRAMKKAYISMGNQ